MSKPSLRSLVFQYIRDHPSLLNLTKKEQNIELCEAFGATGETAQNGIKRYKAQYFSELEFARFKEQQDRLQKPDPFDGYFDITNKGHRRGDKAGAREVKAKRANSEILARLQPWDKLVKCPHCPGLYANEVMKFVGFRGYIDKNGVCSLDLAGKEHQGEAWPPPVVPVSNINRENLMRLTGMTRKELGSRFFLGILKYELEIMTLMFLLGNMGYENIALLMPRGHGKTYIFDWDELIGLKHFNKNYMMLSETNARKKVGNWVYVWALRNKYLKDPEKFARKSTYQHFEMINGSRMDIYKFSAEDLVGEHDYILKLDDCVKRKWKERPSENQKMIDHFQSNINYIIRSGLHLAGTRKFEGDLIQHILETIEDIIIIKMSPFIECEHGNRNDNDTYDPCEICKDLALLAPEIHSYKSLISKMYEDFEAWYAEMMQNPHPMEGGMVDESDIQYCNRPHWTKTKMIVIGVDSTESDLDSVDMCGIVSVAMLKGTELPEFVFLDADVRKMPFRNTKDHKGKLHRGILETIGFYVKKYEMNYPRVPILVAIERQGGGVFIIKEARTNKLPWFKRLIGEKDKTKKGKGGHKAVRYGIYHSKEKTARVFSELRHPIKEGQVKFAYNLDGSIFVRQVCTFPKGRFDDGVDAGGMAKDEALKKWFTPAVDRKPKEIIKQELRIKKAAEAHMRAGQPWLKDMRGRKY